MRKPQKNINSLADLLKHLKKDTADYKGNIWFQRTENAFLKLETATILFTQKQKHFGVYSNHKI